MTVGPATGPQNSAYSPTFLSPTSIPMRLLTPPLLALTACRPGVPAVPVPELPAAVAPAAGTSRYALAEHRHLEQTVQGRPIISDAATRLVFSIATTSTDSGFAAAVLVESVTLEGDTGGMGGAARASGARLTGHLGPSGTRFVRDDDSGPYELLDQLALNLHQLLPPLPPGGARPQTAWSDTAVVTGRAAGIPVIVTSQATSRAGPWDRLDGSLVLRVTRSTAYTLEGEGNPAGSWIVLRGRGMNHTHQVLDSAGGIVHGVQADTLRVEIEVAGTGFVMPILQTRADTLRRATP